MERATRTRLEQLLGAGLLAAQSLGGGHGVRHYRLTLAGGRMAFAKIQDQDPYGNAPDSFAAEAHGLRWLGEAGAAPAPAVLASDPACLVTDWIDKGRPTRDAARAFGCELARLHAAGAASFGAPWPGVIAGLPLPNDAADSWPDWYAANRLLPYARIASDAGTLGQADTRLIEAAAARSADLAGPPEPPSRIHGDCWSGNVLWSAGRGWLIDPAAHGGHRESDLAMLALFGAPFLDQILASYAETVPLADGWQTRIPLHQLHPLLVHVCLFGGSYREAAVSAARAVLAV
jgi:fructosamine-3-kinase